MRKKANMPDNRPEFYLEPRVAKLEVGLDRLTDDVRNLAVVVREQGSQMEGEIQKLVVAVTQAAGPRKTDWGVIVAGLGLVLAIGSAVFYSLNQTTQDNKIAIEKYHESMVEHMKLDMHPVGLALVKRLEEQLNTHIQNNAKEFTDHVAMDAKENEELRSYFKEQLACSSKFTEAKIALAEAKSEGVQKYNELYIDKLFGRVQVLEQERFKIADKEHDELMLWRQKAMGLSLPEGFVPLVSRESQSPPRPMGPPPPTPGK